MAEPTDSTDPTASFDESLRPIAQLILDAGGPVAESDVSEWAEQLGVVFKSDTELRRRLTRQFSEIRYSRISGAFTWDDQPAAPVQESTPRVPELLERWVGDLPGQDRSELAAEIERQVTSGGLSGAEAALARAVGAVDGAPDWTLVPCDESLSAAVVGRLIDRAEPWWLLDAATSLPSRLAEAPKKKFQALSVTDRNEVAAASVERWLRPPAERSASASRLRRLKSAVGDEFAPLLVMTVVREAENLIKNSLIDDEDTIRQLAALAFVVASADRETVTDAISRIFHEPEAVRSWVTAVAAASKKTTDRVALISAIAASSRRSAIFDSSAYVGLDIETLGRLLSQPEFEELLNRGLAEHVRPVMRRATPAKVGPALAAVAEFPVLEPLVPLEFLSNLLAKDEPSSRVLRKIAERLVTDAVQVERELSEGREAELRARLSALDEQRESALDAAQRAEDRAGAADAKRRQAISQSGSARDAELRQAQIDALRALADDIEATRGILATLGRSEMSDQHLLSSIRRIEGFGIVVDGRPGDRVTYDPGVHQPIDAEPGTVTELVTPVYRLADSVTPLRYGLVRRVPLGD